MVLALPLAFLAHDVGEVRGNSELNEVLADLAAGSPVAARIAASMRTTDRQMAVAVSALSTGCVALSVRAVRRPAPSSAATDFAAVTTVIGGHVLGHVVQSLLLRRRVPGLTAGLAVTVPYSVLVVRRLRVLGYVEGGAVARKALAGTLLLGPMLALVRAAARRLG